MTPEEVPPGPLAVDTDVFSYVHYRKGPWESLQGLLVGHPLALSFASVGELRAGAIKRNWGATRVQQQERFLSTYTVIRPDSRVVEQYAFLHAALHHKLKRGGVNDMWTAACALTFGLPLVTNDLADFTPMRAVAPGLTLVHPGL